MYSAMKVTGYLNRRRVFILTSSAAMKRMAASNVLIVGVKGLGVEIGMWHNVVAS